MKIAVFCGSSTPHNNEITNAAHKLGRRLADEGHTLVYGGSNLGIMGVVSGAALEASGFVVGVIPTIFSEEIIRSQPVNEIVRVKSMAERKEYIISNSDAFIALPGGIGTLDEVLEVMVANQLKQIDKPIALFNYNGFFNPFLEQIERMGEYGFFRQGIKPHIIASTTIDDLLEEIFS